MVLHNVRASSVGGRHIASQCCAQTIIGPSVEALQRGQSTHRSCIFSVVKYACGVTVRGVQNNISVRKNNRVCAEQSRVCISNLISNPLCGKWEV